MKYKIQNTNNLVAISGRIGFINQKFDSLTSVSIANNLNNKETEWCFVTYSNPNNNFNGVDWADYANSKLKKGDFIMTICYEKVNGEYTNYYVNVCDKEKLFYHIPNTEQYAIVGKVIKKEKKSNDLYLITLEIGDKKCIIAFKDNEKVKRTKFAEYLKENQIISCIATKVVNGSYINYFANAYEYGPK